MSLFYVMPYVEGETLRDRLEREQQLPVDGRGRGSHGRWPTRSTTRTATGVIHRDIKPANILLARRASRWWRTSASPWR